VLGEGSQETTRRRQDPRETRPKGRYVHPVHGNLLTPTQEHNRKEAIRFSSGFREHILRVSGGPSVWRRVESGTLESIPMAGRACRIFCFVLDITSALEVTALKPSLNSGSSCLPTPLQDESPAQVRRYPSCVIGAGSFHTRIRFILSATVARGSKLERPGKRPASVPDGVSVRVRLVMGSWKGCFVHAFPTCRDSVLRVVSLASVAGFRVPTQQRYNGSTFHAI